MKVIILFLAAAKNNYYTFLCSNIVQQNLGVVDDVNKHLILVLNQCILA